MNWAKYMPCKDLYLSQCEGPNADFWSADESNVWCMLKTSECEVLDNRMENFKHINVHRHQIHWPVKSEDLKLHHYETHGQAASLQNSWASCKHLQCAWCTDMFAIFWHKRLFPR